MKKKSFILLTIFIGILFLTGCSNNLNTVKEIDFTTLQSKIDNKEWGSDIKNLSILYIKKKLSLESVKSGIIKI